MSERKIANNHYPGLDVVRVIAIAGIVLMHVLANGNYDLSGFLFEKVIGTAGNFTILFMMVSAFGMCCGYYEKFKSGKVNLEKFYIRRFEKNLPFFALLVCIDTLFSIKTVLWRDVFSSLTMAFNLMPSHDMSVIGVGWTLGVIFVFYFMFPFYIFLLSTKKRAWFTVIICYILNWCCCNYYESVGKTDGANFLFLSVYFVIGGVLYLYKDYIQEKVSRIPTFVVLLATAVITMVWYFIPANEFSLFFTVKTSILFAIWVIFAISQPMKLLENSVTKTLSQVSLEVYLSHMMIFRVVEKFGIADRINNGNIAYIVVLFLTIILTIVFALIAKRVIDICFRRLKKAER